MALAWLAGTVASGPVLAQADAGYRSFLTELWPEAQRMGISRATFDRAFEGVEPDRSLPDLLPPGQEVKGQAEFTRTPAQYLDADYLGRLSEQGRALLKQHAAHLEKIETELGVQRQFVLAIWGRGNRLRQLPFQLLCGEGALATQAYLGRRKDMFRTELLYALKMLEDGVRTRENMTGSWAGAMGLTQFMPSEYYTVAYDLDGDGRKGYLDLDGRCAGLRRQPAARQGLGPRPELGLRGGACPRASPVCWRARTIAGRSRIGSRWGQPRRRRLSRRRCGGPGLPADAGGQPWPRLPGA